MDMYSRSSSVEIKGEREISLMREVSRLAAGTLERVGPMLRAGITTQEINDFVHADTLRRAPRAAQLPRLSQERLHVDQ
jgi:methionyl aminopeptidase